MERWKASLDRWLTQPPEPSDVVVTVCDCCNDDITEGELIVKYRPAGLTFCGDNCLAKYLINNIKDEVDYFIEFLECEGDVVEDVAEER